MTETTKKAPYHHRNLREALVTAGRTLLEERGMRGFTLRECARRAEVSHAAPAHHFASLDDCWPRSRLAVLSSSRRR